MDIKELMAFISYSVTIFSFGFRIGKFFANKQK